MIIAPSRPSLVTPRSSSSAAAFGSGSGSAAKPLKRVGLALIISARKSFDAFAIVTDVSGSRLCAAGLFSDSTAMSMPPSSMSLISRVLMLSSIVWIGPSRGAISLRSSGEVKCSSMAMTAMDVPLSFLMKMAGTMCPAIPN